MKTKTPPELPLLEEKFGKGKLVFVDFLPHHTSRMQYARRRVETGLENVVRILSNGTTFPLLRVVERVERHPDRLFYDSPIDGCYELEGTDAKGNQRHFLLHITDADELGGEVGEKIVQLFGETIQLGIFYHEMGHQLYRHLFGQEDRDMLYQSFSTVSTQLLDQWGSGWYTLERAVNESGLTHYGVVEDRVPQPHDYIVFNNGLLVKVKTIQKVSPKTASALRAEGVEQRDLKNFSVLRTNPEEAFADTFQFYMRSRMREGTGVPARPISAQGFAWYCTARNVIEQSLERFD